MAKVKDDYREESVWRAWLNCLPLVSEVSHEEQGWETLSLLVTHPPARLESLIKEKLGLLTGVFEKAHRHGAMDAASEKTLLGLLILRSRSSTNSSTLEAADHAWRRAWNALPGPPRFPSEEPWVGKMLSKIDTPQMLAWKEWFLTSNLSEPSVSRKGPRL